MPPSGEILAGLERIANDAFAIAVLWHVGVAVVLLALLCLWRPSRRLAAVGLALPLASVSVLAWGYANPFNGTIFALLAVVVGTLGARASREPIAMARGWTAAVGALLVAFAWVYPHFLASRSPLAYLYGSPLGLIPCPTLSLAIGLALVTGVPGGRWWSVALAAGGLFYALFGALRLGVWLDLALLAGALALLLAPARAPLPRGGGRRWRQAGALR